MNAPAAAPADGPPPDPVRAVAARRFGGLLTAPQWYRYVESVLAHVEALRAKRKSAIKLRGFILFGLFVATALGFTFGGPLVGVACVVVFIIAAIVAAVTTPKAPAVKDLLPLRELCERLSRELAPELLVRIDADISRGDEKDKALAAAVEHVPPGPPPAGRRNVKVATQDFADRWLAAAVAPAQGVVISWHQVDVHRRTNTRWTNARGKLRQRTRFDSRSTMFVRLDLARKRWTFADSAAPPPPDAAGCRVDFKEGERRLRVAVRHTLKGKARGDDPHPGDTSAIASLIAVACARVRPLTQGGKTR